MLNFRMAFTNASLVAKNIEKKFKRMGDRKTANARAVAYIDGWIQRNFREEGRLSMGGAGWSPLKQSTVMKRRHGRNSSMAGKTMILQDRGWLRSKWKHLFTPSKIAVQSSMEYGIYHDSDKPRHRLPQRRIIPRQKQVATMINKIYRDHIREALKS